MRARGFYVGINVESEFKANRMIFFLLAGNTLILLFACVGMMAVFLGGGGYLSALLLLLLLALPFSSACFIGSYGWFVYRRGIRDGWKLMWALVPRWQLVALALVVALILCGELALYLSLLLADEAPRFWQHLPLLSGTLAALAYVAIEALREANKSRS